MWLSYAIMTMFFWGVYGVLLHMARGFMPDAMAKPPTVDTANAGLKAFLLVCVAYAVIGVAAGYLLRSRGANFTFGGFSGLSMGLLAGLAGAAGAFTLVLALGEAAGKGGYGALAATAVMPLVFGGAPVVNSIVSILKTRGVDGLKNLPIPFIVGIVMVAAGGFMVAKFTPQPLAHGPAPATPAASAAAAPLPIVPLPTKAPETSSPAPSETKPAAPAPSGPQHP